ncbi:carboxypeptidase-like regulatory domain-containing protein [Phaeodactylibacter luteus]|uniref:Carboxypeptidase regulatory-like domain-containing protein n=1 Tax=Phaeodactylibacter luteus TaxID=1564516 RepID=A0A5C6RJX1_9BACT|nr:carboxypeptidase-like regulatory domain-containing protein [Phaeodactylibacter luteus]TXB62517.1 carboxypeptidase regulatory-like domain-containing protein [Phaeodactylibacter luteus]
MDRSGIHLQVKQAVGRGRLVQAMDILENSLEEQSPYADVLTILRARLSRVKQEEQLGAISVQEAGPERVRVQIALLELSAAWAEGKAVPRSGPAWPWARILAGTGLGLLLLASAWLFWPASSDSLTVFVHGKNGVRELPLQNRGAVRLIYGQAVRAKGINEAGQAVFNEIPASFFSAGAQVRIEVEDTEGEPYYNLAEDSLYNLRPGQPVFVAVGLSGLDRLFGSVQDFETGQPIAGATVRVGALHGHSDSTGWFSISIPEAEQRQFQTLRVFKEGYTPWKASRIPPQAQQEIEVMLKIEQ